MKTTRHSILAKGIIVLLSLLVLIFILTYAWYMPPDSPVYANGMSFSTNSGADFDVAIGFETPYYEGQYLVSEFTSQNTGNIDFESITIPATVTGGPSDNVTVKSNPTISEPVNLLRDFKPVDLTGDGVTLYRPTMLMRNGYRYIDATSTTVDKNIKDNKQFISFDLYVRSTAPSMKISLDAGSYVVSAAEVAAASNNASYKNLDNLKQAIQNGSNDVSVSAQAVNNTYLKGSDVARKSDYGNFSEDSVVGAVRVSFTQYKNCSNLSTLFSSPSASPGANDYQLDSEKSLLWIPRSDIYLQDSLNRNDHPWVLMTDKDTSGTPNWQSNASFEQEKDYLNYNTTKTYAAAASQHYYYDETKFYSNGQPTAASQRYTKVDGAVTSLNDVTQTTIVNISTDSNLFDGKYYYGKCRVNLWIEGCDAEARKAIDGGSFFFGFDLTGH